jgi:hypothetical protein
MGPASIQKQIVLDAVVVADLHICIVHSTIANKPLKLKLNYCDLLSYTFDPFLVPRHLFTSNFELLDTLMKLDSFSLVFFVLGYGSNAEIGAATKLVFKSFASNFFDGTIFIKIFSTVRDYFAVSSNTRLF